MTSYHSHCPTLSFLSHIFLRLNAWHCVQCVGCLQGNMCYDKNLACDGWTAHYWQSLHVKCNGLKDSHLLYLLVYHNPLVISWRISKLKVIVMSLCTFFTSVQCQMLRHQTCNWDNSGLKWPWTFCSVLHDFWGLQQVYTAAEPSQSRNNTHSVQFVQKVSPVQSTDYRLPP